MAIELAIGNPVGTCQDLIMIESRTQPSVSVATLPHSGGPVPGARVALMLLLSINLFNYIDRQILSAVEPDIRRHLLLSTDPNDEYANTKMGLLALAFMLTYMLRQIGHGIGHNQQKTPRNRGV